MKHSIFFPVAALCLLASHANGQQGRVLTFDEALRIARATHPQFKLHTRRAKRPMPAPMRAERRCCRK